MHPTLQARLICDHKKLTTLITGLQQLSTSQEPIGKVLRRTQIAEGLEVVQESVPLGVVLVIFEARPDGKQSRKMYHVNSLFAQFH